MKKTGFLTFALIALLGVSSCSKEGQSGNLEATGAGKLSLSFGFEPAADVSDQTPGTKAPTSTAVPTTTWAKNIKSMGVLIVDATGTIRYVKLIDQVPTSTIAPAPTSDTYVFTGIPSGTGYNAYVIANYDQTSSPFATSGVSVAPSTSIGGALVGTSINNLLLNLATATGVVGSDPAGSALKTSTPEIFIAKTAAAFNIVEDTNVDLTGSPLKLTRAVSLVRVRVNKTPTINNNVDFTHANTTFRIRRHPQALKVVGGTVFGPGTKDNQTLYLPGALSTNNNPSDYSAAIGVSPTDFHAWKDYLIFPGGSATTSADKYNIVIGGMAPIGYVPYGTNIPLTAPTMVYWTGAVNSVFTANKIISLNLTLDNPGSTIIDPPFTYGNLKIAVDLVAWDTNVENIAMPL